MGADLLTIGKSGLFASKKSLETTGHNISNVNTEGYSRQRVHQETNIPIGNGNIVEGTGVRVRDIKRIHDQHLEKRLRNNLSENEFFKTRSDKLSQVESIFNEINSDGLNQLLNRFFNSFRELANQPENETMRSMVRENGKLVSKDFKRIKSMLRSINDEIGNTFKQATVDINQMLHSIAKLNKRIVELETINGETGDLRDQRDLTVRNLSEYFKLHTYIDDRNNFIINADGIGSIVSGVHVQEMVASKASNKNSSNGEDGSFEVYLKNKPDFPITTKLDQGMLGSMATVRNQNISKLMHDIDQLAFHLGNSVNAIHSRGFVNKNFPVDQAGNPIIKSSDGPVTGIDFFKSPLQVKGAADDLDVSKLVSEDLNNITTALAPNKPGDNRIAIAMSKLQHEKMLSDGTKTLEEQYLETIGHVGLSSSKSKLDAEQTEGILSQTKALRERISGVSIDEETANMVKFQHAYDASARVMRTADEMFKSVLSIMP